MKTLTLTEPELELLRFIVGDFIEAEYTGGAQTEKSCKTAEGIQRKIKELDK